MVMLAIDRGELAVPEDEVLSVVFGIANAANDDGEVTLSGTRTPSALLTGVSAL